MLPPVFPVSAAMYGSPTCNFSTPCSMWLSMAASGADPKRFGPWHTIYTRMNRWSKSGVLDAVFERLQREQLVRIRIESVSLDSTSVKVHPDGTGALKKRPPSYRQVPRRMDHQDSYGCRECSNGHNVRPLRRDKPRMPSKAANCWPDPTARPLALDYGHRL